MKPNVLGHTHMPFIVPITRLLCAANAGCQRFFWPFFKPAICGKLLIFYFFFALNFPGLIKYTQNISHPLPIPAQSTVKLQITKNLSKIMDGNFRGKTIQFNSNIILFAFSWFEINQFFWLLDLDFYFFYFFAKRQFHVSIHLNLVVLFRSSSFTIYFSVVLQMYHFISFRVCWGKALLHSYICIQSNTWHPITSNVYLRVVVY